jgi:hypothetical protein
VGFKLVCRRLGRWRGGFLGQGKRYDREQQDPERHVSASTIGKRHCSTRKIRRGHSAWLWSFSLYIASAFCREERVFRTAGFGKTERPVGWEGNGELVMMGLLRHCNGETRRNR